MIEHLVLFKLKPEAGEAEAQAMMDGLSGLKGVVDGLIDLTVGRNFSSRAQGFDLGLVVRLADEAALARYAEHPAHRRVVDELVKPHVENVLAVDYHIER